jgi:hypothetical protein
MSEVASRLYSSADAAESAASALRKAGYQPGEMTVISPPKGKDAAARDAVVAAALAAGVFKRRAGELADGVVNGATAVICQARFAQTTMVRGILDARGPLDASDTSASTTSAQAESAVFSDMLGIPVLGGRGDLLSRLFGLPTLSRQQRGSASLIGESGPYKPVIPMPTLSGADGPGGYKPSIPMPLLSGGGGGYRPVIPMPTLSKSDQGGYRPVIPLPLLTGD